MTPKPPSRKPRSATPAGRRSPSGRSTTPARRSQEGLGGEQVEGRQAVLELLTARRRTVRKIYMADTLEPAAILDAIEDEARRQRVLVQHVSWARIDRDARTEGHQGVYAEAERLRDVELDVFLSEPSPFLLVADGVTDPRNLGAMLRSADGAGVTGVVLPRHRSARISPTVTKTAAGAVEHLRFAQVGGIPTAIERMNKAGLVTVGLAGEARQSLYDLDLGDVPVALVVGGEESGLAQLTRKRCAAVVSIPQLGKISSLNAGVAASVAAFEVARQRRQ
ncbi:MAG: 23S rRNA (guanosine(2251)-2'-O)-methyltransferase RlmB [Acidobacteria bacterium]|nr:23S rRNA (guanosine(2251)-2'-O)-methyltransferase RlmB [Acidobacteriota bacterium]